MFNNRFNSTKKDPLVEAVQSAMQDGEIRRQAVAQVNEAFGVFNRNAVVREQLAAYDAAIEEAYKCMKEGEKKDEKKEDKPKADYSKMREKMVGKGKDLETTRKIVGEAKKLADKDYDKDGKVESPKDEVWGSRFRAAKMAGKMEEEQIDELKAPTAKTAHDAYRRAERSDDEKGNWDRSNRLYKNLKKKYPGKSDRNQKPTGKAKLPQVSNTEFHKDGYSGHVTKKGKLTKSATKDTKADIKSRLGRHTKPNLPEETDYSAPDRAAVTRDNRPSTPAQTNAATSGPSAADKAALTSKIKTMKEAVYSAKAARAGKDIGKPGKEFKKIAAKAGKKYGSEERGKKVAGAILARIRAKHMKEEQIDEIVTQAQLKSSGLSLRDYMNKERGLTRRDSSAPAAKTSTSTPQGAVGLKGPTGDAFSKTATQPGSQRWADPGSRDYSKSNQGTMKTPAPSAPTPAPEKTSWHAPMVRPPQELASKTADVNTGAPKVAQGAPMPTATAAAPKNKEAGALPKTMAESVQVGANKYRIV